MRLADVANTYIAIKPPWVLAKDEKQRLPKVSRVCTVALNFVQYLGDLTLKPVMPT